MGGKERVSQKFEVKSLKEYPGRRDYTRARDRLRGNKSTGVGCGANACINFDQRDETEMTFTALRQLVHVPTVNQASVIEALSSSCFLCVMVETDWRETGGRVGPSHTTLDICSL